MKSKFEILGQKFFVLKSKKPWKALISLALQGSLITNNIKILLVPGAGIEPARLSARDFESRASTYSAIPATQATIMTEPK